jgi:hypothetical protein
VALRMLERTDSPISFTAMTVNSYFVPGVRKITDVVFVKKKKEV